MDETVLLPSPNWFLNSCMAVSPDGWIIYGGPSRSLCVLEPIPATYNAVMKEKSYKAHVSSRAGVQKVISVDITPEWPTKRAVLTGTSEGEVKHWNITYDDKNIVNLKVTLAHNIHVKDKEEVVAVGFSNATLAVTLGCYGNIVKWDLSSNVVKTYNSFLKGLKPTCMSCSKHNLLNVAVGTKQGVVFLIDLNTHGNILYKVRAHDEDVQNLSWCPQYEVLVKKSLHNVPQSVSKRLQVYSEKSITEVENAGTSKDDKETRKISEDVSETPSKAADNSETENNETMDDTVEVEEEDMFDVYKEHAADEFGHKKYQPEEIFVKVKEEENNSDFLAECLKLKDDILNRKEKPQEESSLESLVDALEKAHVNGKSTVENGSGDHKKSSGTPNAADKCSPNSVHVHRQLLATIDKSGNIRIWSKSGKQVASSLNKQNQKNNNMNSPHMTLLWYKPDVLLFYDNKSQLLACNPLFIDGKNKFACRFIDCRHKRNVFTILSTGPRVQTQDTKVEDWPIFMMAQNRIITEYSLMEKRALFDHGSCGGFVYTITSCPYDPKKIAVSVGDGAVRVWEVDTAEDDDSKLISVRVRSFWQNVQGKVLTVAWHPTRENVLAFATAESRIGVIDTSKPDKPAKTLAIASGGGGVYSISWCDNYKLYACGAGEFFLYQVDKPDAAPLTIEVQLEGKVWKINAVDCSERGLVVGNQEGAVAILNPDPPHQIVAAVFPFNKMIHHMEWHPQQVSESNEESKLKNLIAVCSVDRDGAIAILEYSDIDGVKLSSYKTLVGHSGAVVRVAWNPHRDGVLLSSSQDYTVRVWDVESSVCTSVFAGHHAATLGITWSPLPSLSNIAMSGGADCSMRLWNIHDHPAELYPEKQSKKKKKKSKKPVFESPKEATTADATLENKEKSDNEDIVAINYLDLKQNVNKRYLLSFTNRELMDNGKEAVRIMFNKYLAKTDKLSSTEVVNEPAGGAGVETSGPSFLKLFGSINEVNEFLDEELQRHLDADKEDAWIMLMIFRGEMDKVFEFANERDIICPYLLSLAPCVSFKFWKTVTQMYVAQVDRLIARCRFDKLNVVHEYGGPVMRKTATLLSIHNVSEAIETMLKKGMYKEAYMLCRVRHMDSIAESIILKWAERVRATGVFPAAAVLYLVIGDISNAASVLARCDSEVYLSIGVTLAKMSGETTFADHIAEKQIQIKLKNDSETTEILETLPSRLECLMKQSEYQNSDTDCEE